jgi:hypothetical protein
MIDINRIVMATAAWETDAGGNYYLKLVNDSRYALTEKGLVPVSCNTDDHNVQKYSPFSDNKAYYDTTGKIFMPRGHWFYWPNGNDLQIVNTITLKAVDYDGYWITIDHLLVKVMDLSSRLVVDYGSSKIDLYPGTIYLVQKLDMSGYNIDKREGGRMVLENKETGALSIARLGHQLRGEIL